jgi:hypothetical protein
LPLIIETCVSFFTGLRYCPSGVRWQFHYARAGRKKQRAAIGLASLPFRVAGPAAPALLRIDCAMKRGTRAVAPRQSTRTFAVRTICPQRWISECM